MIKSYKKLSSYAGYCIMLMLIIIAGTANAQLVTNGGFESSNTGVVDTTEVKGWLIQVATGVTTKPVFEIVSDTVEEGNRALKVTVHGLGTNQWDIQIVVDSIPVTPGGTYNYSVWAKSLKAGAQVNLTMGNYAFTEYKVIRPANLTTQWQQFTMQFTVNDNQTFIRGPIHFNYAADTGNAIYIDNLQIAEVITGVAVADRPEIFKLEQNYPNPFNPSTKITFSLPHSANASLKVVDILGREVATLVNGFTTAGNHEVQFDATYLTSGVYFYKLTSGNFTEVKKMMLVK